MITRPTHLRLVRPAGQSDVDLPPGVPTGPVDQPGGSLTTEAVLVVAGGLAAVALLSYVLTRPAPEPARAPTPRRRKRR